MQRVLSGVFLFLFCLFSVAQTPDEILQAANKNYSAKQYGKAALLYAQCLDSLKDRKNPDIEYNAACSFSRAGNHEKAFEHLNKAIEDGWIDKKHTFSDPDLVPLYGDEQWKLFTAAFEGKIEAKKTDYTWGVYFGILFILFFYNLFLLLMLRTKVYLFYTLLILVFAQLEYATNPPFAVLISKVFFWMPLLAGVKQAFICFASLATMAYLLFVREFLQLKSKSKKLDLTLKILIVALAIQTLLTYFLRFPVRPIAYSMWLISYGVAIGAGIYCWRKGYRPARFFVLAASLHTIGVFLGTANDIGLIHFDITFGVLKSYNIGGIGFLISLALALGDQINILKKEKENAQQKALENLEEKVRERTNELKEQKVLIEEKNKEVMDSIRYASRIQRALITSEKYISRNLKRINNP
ncbi:MAG: hypothetical protein IAF38_03335 [Bacteroidia bacterium]|nr:hypothetical protein [Bacteroidia bacterium]